MIVSKQAAGQGSTASPAPSGSATHSAIAPGDSSPGSSGPLSGLTDGETLLSKLANPENVGPGMLVIGGSLLALVATRYIRAEQDRKAYRRHYSATWG
jgi:hypothetical protein